MYSDGKYRNVVFVLLLMTKIHTEYCAVVRKQLMMERIHFLMKFKKEALLHKYDLIWLVRHFPFLPPKKEASKEALCHLCDSALVSDDPQPIIKQLIDNAARQTSSPNVVFLGTGRAVLTDRECQWSQQPSRQMLSYYVPRKRFFCRRTQQQLYSI